MKSKLTILAALLIQAIPLSFASDAVAPAGPTADGSLARLIEGNKRFVAGTSTHPHQGTAYRAALANGQKPIAAILTCADSRVSPELLFDQGLGDIFACRVAGNILDNTNLGSLEYAVEHLHVPLIIVLGHEKCGAVKAAVDGGSAPGHIGSLVDRIAPSVLEAKTQSGDLLDNAVRLNVQRTAKLLSVAEPIISENVKEGKVKVVGARYDLATGTVEIIPLTNAEAAPKTAKAN